MSMSEVSGFRVNGASDTEIELEFMTTGARIFLDRSTHAILRVEGTLADYRLTDIANDALVYCKRPLAC